MPLLYLPDIHKKDVLSQVEPWAVMRCLANHGWFEGAGDSKSTYFTKMVEQESQVIAVPMQETYSDYPISIYYVLQKLMHCEDIPDYNLFAEMLNIQADNSG